MIYATLLLLALSVVVKGEFSLKRLKPYEKNRCPCETSGPSVTAPSFGWADPTGFIVEYQSVSVEVSNL